MEETVLSVERPVVRNGKSRAITIPNHIADLLDLELGQTVRIDVLADGSLLIHAVDKVPLPGGGTLSQLRRTKLRKAKNVQDVPLIPEGRTIRGKNPFIEKQPVVIAKAANQ